MDLKGGREMGSGEDRAEAGTQVSWLRRVTAKSFATIIS